LETPLGCGERPKGRRYSQGRFIAKTPRYLDSEVYKPGRRGTVAGEIIGREIKPLGNTEYTYPMVMVKEVHLWRKYRVYANPYPYYWYGPGSWWPYYDDWDD